MNNSTNEVQVQWQELCMYREELFAHKRYASVPLASMQALLWIRAKYFLNSLLPTLYISSVGSLLLTLPPAMKSRMTTCLYGYFCVVIGNLQKQDCLR